MLLLTAAAAATSFPILTALVKELWLGALAILGSLVTITLYVRKESKEKRLAEQAALDARFKKVEEENHGNSLKHQAAQQERERLVDAYNLRMGQLENKVSQVDNIVHEVNALKSRMDVQAEKMDNLGSKLSDLRADLKAQFGEVMYLLKEKRDK